MKKVNLILIDGMRPDAFVQCGNPYVQKLLSSSAYSLNARTVYPARGGKGHGGGDEGIVKALLDAMENEQAQLSTNIAASIESHLMAEAAERSRREHRMVDVREIRGE